MTESPENGAEITAPTTNNASALAGLRVLEIGEMVSAPYCAKLLGDLGAEVIKIEPRGGDPARRAGPFPRSAPEDPEQSALFLYLNTNKRSLCLDLETGEARPDRRSLIELIRRADVLVENQPGLFDRLGLGEGELTRLAPGLVHTSISPYGRSGPRRDQPGDELTLTHGGGLGFLLPTRSSSIERAPVKLGGYQVGYHGGLVAAMATLAALLGRDPRSALGRTGRSIDVSLQEVVLALVGPAVAGTRYHRLTYSRVPDRPPAMGRMRARDGYVILNAFDDHHFAELRKLMGNPAWCAGDQWLSMAYRAQHLLEIAPQIEAWVAAQDKTNLHREAGERGIPIGPIDDAKDVLANPQFAARDYFVEVDHPDVGRLRYPGWPYRMSESPPAIRTPAPHLGQLSLDEALSSWTARATTTEPETGPASPPPDERSERQSSSPHPSEQQSSAVEDDAREGSAPTTIGTQLPLAGLRVLELCWVWAGPYCGAILASLGADVIKVEGHRRTDLTRRSVVWPLADAAPSKVPPNRGMAFNQVNLNKRSLTLDLRQADGRDLARRLAAKSDVVVDNMRPGALGKLGLGPDDLRALSSHLIVASSSGRGSVGPEREYLGYAMVHHGIGGGAHITGYPDDAPSHSGGDVDLMNAIALALSIVAALHHRARTGKGQYIDYSQCEGVTSLLGEVILGHQLTGEIPQRDGNRHPNLAPHSVYRAWGVDRWIAIEIHDDDEFGRLATTIGRPELATDPLFAKVAERKSNEEELDRIVEAWTRERDRDWMVRKLGAAGVHVAPSRNAADLYAEPHLRERGAFLEVDHPEIGVIELIGMPFRMSGTEMPVRVAPALGRDTEAILGEVLGLEAEEIERLRASDVIL